MSSLRRKLIRIAASLPRGSDDRKTLLKILVEEGKKAGFWEDRAEWWTSHGWETLKGSAFAKAKRILNEEMDYAKKFGRKSVFARDSLGVFRLRAIGNDGRIYAYKAHSLQEVEKMAPRLARAAAVGEPEKGMYFNGFART